MKRNIFIYLMPVLAMLFMAFYPFPAKEKPMAVPPGKMEIPADVQQVIQKACYGCHHTKSKNLKGKKKLDFDKLGSLKTYKLVGKMQDISDILAKGKMPPKKFIAKYPDKKLTQEEKNILTGWATETISKLTK